jgi:hypothetical protein
VVQIIDNTPSAETMRMRALSDPMNQLANSINQIGDSYLQARATQRQRALDFGKQVDASRAANPYITDQDVANKYGMQDALTRRNQTIQDQQDAASGKPSGISGFMGKLGAEAQKIPAAVSDLFSSPDQKIVSGMDYSALQGKQGTSTPTMGQSDSSQSDQPNSIAKILSNPAQPSAPVSPMGTDLSVYDDNQRRQITQHENSLVQARNQLAIDNSVKTSTANKNNQEAGKFTAEAGQSPLKMQEMAANIAEKYSLANKHNNEIGQYKTTKQDNSYTDYLKSTEAFRGSPAGQLAENAGRQADTALAMLRNPNGSLKTNMSMQDLVPVMSEIGKITSGGVPGQEELHKMMPDNVKTRMASISSFLTAKPVNMDVGEYVKKYAGYLQEFKQINADFLNNKKADFLAGYAPKMGNENLSYVQKMDPTTHALYTSAINGNSRVSQHVSQQAAQAQPTNNANANFIPADQHPQAQAAMDYVKQNINSPDPAIRQKATAIKTQLGM